MKNLLNRVEIINNPNEHLNWGLEAINARKMWDKTKGEGVKVLIIDTGIDTNHKDLKHAYKYGINMFEKSNNVTDEYGHGTHVAGIIAGLSTGVAPNVDLYVAKVLNDKGLGSMASVMDGITSAINLNIDVLCMSLGINRELPIILKERIALAYDSGINIVCATGNDGIDKPLYPAFMNEVIGVGGIGRDLTMAEFSNYGEQMDILAPSVEILSTYKDGQYAKMTGTSFASPFVAGAIALLISYNRKRGIELKPEDIRYKLKYLKDNNNGIMDLSKLMD